jgi:hypothetical protein
MRLAAPALVGLFVCLTLPAKSGAEDEPADAQARPPVPDVADPVTALNAVRALVGAPPIPAPPKEEASRVLASVLDVLRKHGNWGSDALAEIRRAVGAPERAPSPGDVYVVRAAACLAEPTTHIPPPVRAIQIRPVSHPDPNVLERSHLFPVLNGLVLEGQFALHVFFWDNFHRLTRRRGGTRRSPSASRR